MFYCKFTNVTPGELQVLKEFEVENEPHVKVQARFTQAGTEYYRVYASHPNFLFGISIKMQEMRKARAQLEQLMGS